jgi:ribonuclease J
MNKTTRLPLKSSKRTFVRALPAHTPLANTVSTPVQTKDALRITPVGGVEEIGINMTAYEYGDDIIIVDMGLGFPPSHIRGVNYIIPNYQWIEEHKKRIRGIFITHAHLDHIGAIPFISPLLGFPPIYSMPLSIGFIKSRATEFSLQEKIPLHALSPDDVVQLGNFKVAFFRVNHNIPDSVGLAITSPAGTVIHTGDWKLDYTPQDEKPAELDKLARWGEKGVLALLSDSTNAKKAGYTLSEKSLAKKIDRIFEETPGRIIFTSNSLLLSRIQQVFDAAFKHNRKVAVVGRSMQNNIEVAHNLGYLKLKPGSMITSAEAKRLPDKRVIILTTGAQGEDNAGLARMARGDHREVQLKIGDTAVISATPIPGNERSMATLVSNLSRIGVQVVFHKLLDIHVSGHASQEELKLMIDLVKPTYLIPIHGELHMLIAHAQLAQSIGMPETHTLIPTNGTTFEFDNDQHVTIQQKRQHHRRRLRQSSHSHDFAQRRGDDYCGQRAIRFAKRRWRECALCQSM